MITYLFPLIGIALGFIGITYILFKRARALGAKKREVLAYPEIKEEKVEITADSAENIITAKHNLLVIVEKFFRKTRIRLMRLENWLEKISKKLHERNLRKKHFLAEKEGNDGDKIIEEKEDRASLIALNKQDEKFDEQYWINILKHDTTSAYPYKKLGEIYSAREDFKEARAVLKYALKLDPSDEEAKAQIEGLKGKRTRTKTESA